MGEINIKYWALHLLYGSKMESENDFMYQALKAFEKAYGIDKKRAAESGDSLYEIIGGFYPPFGSGSRRKVRVMPREYPKDVQEFLSEFVSNPLKNYLRKMIRVGFIIEEEVFDVHGFICGYAGDSLNIIPLTKRLRSLFSRELRNEIRWVKEGYQKGLEARLGEKR